MTFGFISLSLWDQIQYHNAPGQTSLTSQSTQLAGEIMKHKHAAILIYFVSGCGEFFVYFGVFLFTLSVFRLFRLQPSTISTLWTPNSDTQTPSDSHVLHHQQRWSPRRVSKENHQVPVCHKFVFFLSCLTSAPFIADLTPWEGAPNYFFSKTFSLPTKGQMTLSLGGHLQNSPCDVIHRCEILPLKVRLPLNTQAHFSDLWHKNGPER